jgi:hypothetical protein
MTEPMSRRPPPKLRWIVAIAFVVLINVLSLGMQSGQCIDYSAESGAKSICSSGPAIGVAGAWALGVLSLFAGAYFIYRFTKSLRAR